jgi:four helix bundle protein
VPKARTARRPKTGVSVRISDTLSERERGYYGIKPAFLVCMLKDFRAFQLAKIVYQICKILKLPAHLKDQLVRASSSTALNLAESSGERTEKENERYYTIARGSFLESQAILELENIHDPNLADTMNQLGAILYKLCRIAEKRGKSEAREEESSVLKTES